MRPVSFLKEEPALLILSEAAIVIVDATIAANNYQACRLLSLIFSSAPTPPARRTVHWTRELLWRQREGMFERQSDPTIDSPLVRASVCTDQKDSQHRTFGKIALADVRAPERCEIGLCAEANHQF